MRDVLVDAVFQAARRDRDVVLLAADCGAEALAAFRAELPNQLLHCGGSEQHMIDLAAGLSLAGRRVVAYGTASFLATRCYAQIKCSLAAAGRPVTLVGADVGLGPDDAGPTRAATEDLAGMRALAGIEILSPADVEATAAIAERALAVPAFRYVRLERPALPPVHHGCFGAALDAGVAEVCTGVDVGIVASGFMLHRALAARPQLAAEGLPAGVIDLFRVKPLDGQRLPELLARYRALVTVEEQHLAGGFGSAVLEVLADAGAALPVVRLGLPDRYCFENGGRTLALDRAGLGTADIVAAARRLAAQPTATAIRPRANRSIERGTPLA
jgi:transketolase